MRTKMALAYDEELVQSILHGNLTTVPDPPSRVMKIFVSSTKADFEQERRQISEVIIPELQRWCSPLRIDVQIHDIHVGEDSDPMLDPAAFDQQLREIENCHDISLGCFLLSLVGNKYQPYMLPYSIPVEEFEPIHNAVAEAGLDVTLLNQWYKKNCSTIPLSYVAQPINMKYKRYSIRRGSKVSKAQYDLEVQTWAEEQDKLVKMLQYGARVARDEQLITEAKSGRQSYDLSGVHKHLDHALRLSSVAQSRVCCVVRTIEGINLNDPASSSYVDLSSQDPPCLDEDSVTAVQEYWEDIVTSIDRKNVHYFSVPWSENGVDSEDPVHTKYLDKFSEVVLQTLKNMVEDICPLSNPTCESFNSISPAIIKDVIRESQSHLCNCRRLLQPLGVSQSLDSDYGPLLQIQQLMVEQERVRHPPIIVCGKQGCGKSTLLSQAFMYCTEWLGGDTVRLVRHVGHSPCSTYTAELLRNLCLHISLAFNFEVTPKHYSFELGKLSVWFQDILKLVEATNMDLVILLDDLHQLRAPPSNQASILGWLPWNLPTNVHIICSLSEEAETILNLLKSRISNADNFVFTPALNANASVSMLQSKLKDSKHTLAQDNLQIVQQRLTGVTVSPLYIKLLSHIAKGWSSTHIDVPLSIDQLVNGFLSKLEVQYGRETLRKISTYLTCTNYGLREPEIVDLLNSFEMDDSQDYSGEEGKRCDFSASNWLGLKEEMSILWKEYLVGCRPYLHWSHTSITDIIRTRYLTNAEDAYSCHNDLASAFNLGFISEMENKTSPDPKRSKTDYWSDMLREMDELWFHLLRTGNIQKLKQESVCNFDFLQQALNGASISYLRSILELIRCEFLDWDIELLFGVTKQSVDVLSQNTIQLAIEITNWLKPFCQQSSILETLVSQASIWCQNFKSPLLVPQNSWLTLTLPPQVSVLNTPSAISSMATTPDSQKIFITSQDSKDIDIYHLPSKSKIGCLKGHKANITCLHVTCSGRWLVSGSEDTDVIIWDIERSQIKNRLGHHIAGVLCVTTTHSEALLLTGSEIGVLILAQMETGQILHKLENHRGIISCVAVNYEDDVFVTASSDRTVCIWNLEDFGLLNTISVPSGVKLMDISLDSTFLVLVLEDSSVHIRSLATGSEIHVLQGFQSETTAVAFAQDNSRCVLGCQDGKLYVFDIHSARLIQTLTSHTSEITSIKPQENDRFLVTSGGPKVVVWNFHNQNKEVGNYIKAKLKKVDSHQEPITCLAVSRDGTLVATGSKDCQLKVWYLITGEIHTTLKGHQGPIICVSFAPNGLYAVSGSEDTTVKVWGLTVGLTFSTFKEHHSKVCTITITSDSRFILSTDTQSNHCLWVADSGIQLYSCVKPLNQVSLHANMVFAVGGKNDNCVRFWPLSDVGAEKTVSHSDAIICYTVTHDCQTIVTGSQDMSLKVWEVHTAKLTQVLVGHDGSVTCVAVAPYNPALVVSGSLDATLIVWDMNTGGDNLTLRGHTEGIKCVQLNLDGSVAISGSDDNTLQLWNLKNGQRISIVDLHSSIVSVCTSLNANYLVVQLRNTKVFPVFQLQNNPAMGLTLELPSASNIEESKPLPVHGKRGMGPKRVLLKGNLKREQSFDSLYWDLRSGSPKHELVPTLEDFRKSASPYGSRDALNLASNIWEGSFNRGLSKGLLHAEGLPPKHKLPKQKLLKKQQSMFAFFPEFSQHQSPMPPSSLFLKDVDKRLETIRPLTIPSPKIPERKGSAETHEEKESIAPESKKANLVVESAVCSVS